MGLGRGSGRGLGWEGGMGSRGCIDGEFGVCFSYLFYYVEVLECD